MRVTGLTEQQDYLMQADSDFGFLNEIADRSGSDWWMAGRNCIFQPLAESDGSPVTLAVGEDLLAFSVKATRAAPRRHHHPRLVAQDQAVGQRQRGSVPVAARRRTWSGPTWTRRRCSRPARR